MRGDLKKIDTKTWTRITALSEEIAAVASALEAAAEQAQKYHDERSEGWQEGGRGKAYSEWVRQIEAAAEALGLRPMYLMKLGKGRGERMTR